MTVAKVDKISHGHFDAPPQQAAKPKVRPHIAYLDFLKEHGLLEMAIKGQLPSNIEKAAKEYVIGGLREKHGKDSVPVMDSGGMAAVCVTEDEKSAQNEEINDYIRHYELEKHFEPFIYKSLPREIMKGQKYIVGRGWFKGRLILIKGLDTEHFGIRWDENYGHPLSEKYMFRAQQDNLPMRGLVYVVKLMDEKRDILLHESEIGAVFQ